MGSTITFDILPATREDVPRIVQMFVWACMTDNAIKLNYTDADECSRKGNEMFESQIGEPEYCYYKAVDRQTGVIASFAAWKRPTDDQIRARSKQYKASIEEMGNEPEKKIVPTNIAKYQQQTIERVINEWTHNHRHIYFMFLITDPLFQRRGMGSAMVKLASEDADRSSLPILLRASPYGWPIYAQNGYRVIEYIDIDLRDHFPRGRDNDQGLGNYRFRYMMRLPQIPAT